MSDSSELGPGSSSLENPVNISESFFSQILNPGSSLHPTFLLMLDMSLGVLLVVLISLLFMTGGNVHFMVLIVIELGLWASVKWVVHELHNVHDSTAEGKKDS